jgi:hypothetical protein
MVVAALAPSALRDPDGGVLPIDPLSEGYAEAARDFVRAVSDGLGQRPGFIGWSVEAVVPEQVVWDDRGFQRYLRDWYSSLGALNASWGTEFASWEEIPVAGARDVDSGRLFGLGRASMDYAYYRESAYADLLSVWAQAVRSVDADGLVFASALPDYRSIVSVPAGFDGMVLNTYPSLAEADWQTHNVHAVDIARRGNRFAAVQTLEVDASTGGNPVVAWAGMALAHGAAGVSFSSWLAVRDSDMLSAAVAEVARIAREASFPIQPMPRTAILYEPFAGGTLRDGRGIYGYLDGLAPNEPSSLFWAGRNGSRYGLFDVLRVSSLDAADLSQYGAIVAPACFYLPDSAQTKLNNWVLSGGALLADLGIGMYHADGVATSIPWIMRETLGIRYLDIAEDPALRQQTGDAYSPEVDVGEVWDPADPQDSFPVAPGQEGKEIDPAMTRFIQGLEEYYTRADVQQYLGEDLLGATAPTGMMLKGVGRGYAVYAPVFLYETWSASDPAFDEFHNRFLMTGSELAVGEPTGVWPGVAATLSSDWSLAVASPAGAPVSLVLYGGGNQVYQAPGGVTRVGNPAEGDWVELLLPGGAASVSRPVPIHLRPQGEGMLATISVVRYGAEGIELLVYGSGALPRIADGAVEMVGGVQTSAEIEIRNGRYRLPRGSMHRVVAEWGAGGSQRWEREMMPNPETGALVIPGTFVDARITVAPAAEAAE